MRVVGLSLMAVVVGSVSVFTLAGCDETAPPRGSGGSGGTASGTGGTIGTPGTGGTVAGGGGTVAGTGGTAGGSDAAAPDDTASSCSIPCLADIDRECVPSGACMEQAAGPLGIASNRCYDNGVKILTDIAIAFPASTLKITHKKADGSVCFTVEGTVQGTTTATVTWKDAGGAAVATGTYNLTTMAATIMCGDQTFNAQAALGCGATRNLPRAPGSPSTSGCSMGVCM
jgi:hypothetical protein